MKYLLLYLLIFSYVFGYSQKDSTRVKELLDIAYSYEKTSMDSAIHTYKKAAKLATEINYWIGAGRATSYSGIVFSDYGMNDSAIVYHEKSIHSHGADPGSRACGGHAGPAGLVPRTADTGSGQLYPQLIGSPPWNGRSQHRCRGERPGATGKRDSQ